MLTRYWGALLVCLLTLLTAWPHTGRAQEPSVRRWLADPPRLMSRRVKPLPSEGGGIRVDWRQVGDRIAALDLFDRQTGWAVTQGAFVRFDGRYWHTAQETDLDSELWALDLSSATSGWAVGARDTGYVADDYGWIGTTDIQLARFDGARWQTVNEIRRADGTLGSLPGFLAGVALNADGTGWAVGHVNTSNTVSVFARRPLLLYFDGAEWSDRTPAGWTGGWLSSMTLLPSGEGWAGGVLSGVKPGDSAFRPAVAHLKAGAWSMEQVLGVGERPPFGMYGVHMRDSSTGWALYSQIPGNYPSGTLLRYNGGVWEPDPGLLNYNVSDLALFPGTGRGWILYSTYNRETRSYVQHMARFDNGVLGEEQHGGLLPGGLELLDEETQWGISGASFARYTGEPLPTARVAGGDGERRYFPETGHTIAGAFRAYYEAHGLDMGDPGISPRESLGLFGYPISEPFAELSAETGRLLEVQYFERARFEYHPDNPEPYKVLLGRFGVLQMAVSSALPPSDEQPQQPGCQRFPETGQSLCPPFLGYWEHNGGLPVFGFPLAAAREESSPTDGKAYLTQWTERERIEHHPEHAGTPYEMELGLLGAEALRQRGYLD